MSFSNILSGDVSYPPKPSLRATPTSKPLKNAPITSDILDGDAKPASAAPRKSSSKATAPSKNLLEFYDVKRSAKAEPSIIVEPEIPTLPKNQSTHKVKPKAAASDKENEKVKAEMAKIDAMGLSDLEFPEYEDAKQNYKQLGQKRQLDVEATEDGKRKVKRLKRFRNDSSS